MSTTLAIAALSANKAEGNSGTTPFTFTVTRSGDTSGVTTVNYAVDDFFGADQTTTLDGTNTGIFRARALDFDGGALPSGTVTFDAGETSKTITILVAGDTYSETNQENFTVRLSNASADAQIGTATATGIIQNDDLTFTIGFDSATEGPHALAEVGQTSTTIGLIRTGGAEPIPLKVGYFLTSQGLTNPATIDVDVTHSDGTGQLGYFVFDPNASKSAVVTLNVVNDTIAEPTENFLLSVGSLQGLFSFSSQRSWTIASDDVIQLAVAAASATKAEGSSGTTPFTFTVTRSGDSSGTTTVNYAVTGSGAHAADAADFGGALPAGTVSFAAGETSKTITLNVAADTVAEFDEGFTLTLSNPSGLATITTATAAGTIQNDDFTTLAIAADYADRPEGDRGPTAFTYVVTRGGDLSTATTVNYTVAGSGLHPADASDFYAGLPLSGALSFGVGETSKLIVLAVNSDQVAEPDETFSVTLSNASGGATQITTATALGVIRNDDAAGPGDDTFLAAPADQVFNGGAGSDTVDYSGSAGPVVVDLQKTVAQDVGGNNGFDTFLSIENLIGSSVADTLRGSNGANHLTGNDGNDTLVGNGGSDVLDGGAGDDNLNGGAGADEMHGGTGDDLYIVDNSGDQAIENPGEGYDQVRASVAYTLGDNVERLTLTGSGDISGTGNGDDNRIDGNAGNNMLSGGDGSDRLNGGAGNDTLRGGAGHDVLTGGTGSDIFQFESVLAADSDKIADFTAGEDKIAVAASSLGLSQSGPIDPDLFAVGHPTAHHAQFVFDDVHHALKWDSDGIGGAQAVTIALLANGATLHSTDILLV